MSYAERTKRPPRTLSDAEQAKLLKVSGAKKDDFRDHVIFSLALGTGLREMEIVGLDVGDVWNGRLKRMIQLRVFANKGGRRRRQRRKESAAARRKREAAARARASEYAKAQRVHLPEGTYYKLEKYMKWKDSAGFRACDRLGDAPLFWSRLGNRLSTRRLRELFREWQQRAGFDHLYTFHELRHSAITNVFVATGNIRIAQHVARHADIETTTRYEHASDQQVAAAVKRLAS